MPFRLKNVGATYQQLINKIFKDQIDRNMEVYVDDMLIKSHQAAQHLSDLEETFVALKHFQMKLNLTKCFFRVLVRKFLGIIVTQHGIDANPKKI